MEETIKIRNKGSYRSKAKDNFLDILLESDKKMLQGSDITGTLDEFKQYLKECDESKKYRLICTIKPLCSNVLFNMITEIVYNEGGDDCKFYGRGRTPLSGDAKAYWDTKTSTIQGITRADAIADTAFSHKDCGKLVYHCGLDIFNNHHLRANKFFVVNKNGSTNNIDFNTIKDKLRDCKGDNVKGSDIGDGKDEYLYTMDELYGFNEAIDERLVERNGWFGFYNPTTLEIENYTKKNGTEIAINKCMNNNKANEFIDMYPDRSLYSFVPKYNKLRSRSEKNWEYCLTYPAENVMDVDKINDRECDGLLLWKHDGVTINALNCMYQSDKTTTDYVFKTQLHHSLQSNDVIHLYMIDTDGNVIPVYENFTIQSVGDGKYDSDAYFTIAKEDLYPYVSVHSIDNLKFRYTKVYNGRECEYYFRKFKYLPNYAFSNVLADDNVSEEDKTACSQKPFTATSGRMAFAKTPYGDDVVEVLFNDDINISSLRDNLGREVSEIFLTIVKTNYGHEKWYGNKNYTDSSIEFSHCFGKITSGLDLESYNDTNDYNIHKIHNIPSNTTSVFIKPSPKCLEDDITISGTTATPREFLGDIVEFYPTLIEERILEDVYHRFNTAQRECVDDEYSGLTYTEVMKDGLEWDNGANTFSTEERDLIVSDTAGSTGENVSDLGLTTYRANLFSEGYWYKPHYSIRLYEYDDEVQQGEDVRMIFSSIEPIDAQNGKYRITTSQNYYLNEHDYILGYIKPDMKRIVGEVISVSGAFYNIIEVEFKDASYIDFNKCLLFKINPLCPETAYRLNDGSGRYIWRDKMSTADMLVKMGQQAPTFTNGTHYLNKDISFYLKRQDPNGYYGMSDSDGMPTSVLQVIRGGKERDIEKYDYMVTRNETRC